MTNNMGIRQNAIIKGNKERKEKKKHLQEYTWSCQWSSLIIYHDKNIEELYAPVITCSNRILAISP